jgi:hypothetical protein
MQCLDTIGLVFKKILTCVNDFCFFGRLFSAEYKVIMCGQGREGDKVGVYVKLLQLAPANRKLQI